MTGQPPLPALPRYDDRFIGRAADRARLKAEIEAGSLVMLVGPGGSGKTRLALEVGRDLADSGWRTAFVDLSSINSDAAVFNELAVQLAVRGEPGKPLADAVAARLAGRTLLVLDNCEQVLGGCRDGVAALRAMLPELRVVATSRERLRLAGEAVVKLAALSSADSVALFEVRAAGFVLAESSREAVVEICRRLDGLPLAIELVAAWAPVLGIAHEARRIDLLGDAGPGRHRTLRTTLDWSAALLGEAERTLWFRLSVFAPPFDMKAVDAVCSGGTVATRDLPLLLRRLIDRSLVEVQMDQRGVARYRLLETVREYAADRLAAADESEAVKSAHAHHYVAVAEEAFAHRDADDLVAWAEAMTARHANVRVALDQLRGRDHEAELQVAGAMGWVWGARELLPEGRRLLELAVAGSRSTSRAAARAHRAAGFLALEQGDVRSAQVHIERSYELSAAQHDEVGQAICLARLGAFPTVARERRHEQLDRAIGLAERTGERAALIIALASLGELQLEEGDAAAARRTYGDAASAARAMAHARWMPEVLLGLAHANLASGHPEEAVSAVQEALTLARDAALTALTPLLLEMLVEVEAALNHAERALTLAAAAAAMRRRVAVTAPHPYPIGLKSAVARARRALPERARQLADRGRRMTTDEAVWFALADHEPTTPVAISRRQAEVASLVAQGLTNAQIALRLTVSERTAEWHVEELRNKLGFTSRAQVAAWAARQGLEAAPQS